MDGLVYGGVSIWMGKHLEAYAYGGVSIWMW